MSGPHDVDRSQTNDKRVTMELVKTNDVADKDEAVEDLLGFSPIELQEASESSSASEAASCLSCS